MAKANPDQDNLSYSYFDNALSDMFREQRDYNSRIKDRLDRRYPTLMGKIFGYTEAMIDEIGEVHQELKPYWQWWRDLEVPVNDHTISNEKRQRLIEEHIDIFKFLLSNLILLGVDNPGKFYYYYMEKHKIIHERLDQAEKGTDNYLVSSDGKRSLE